MAGHPPLPIPPSKEKLIEVTKSAHELSLYLNPSDPDHSKFEGRVANLAIKVDPNFSKLDTTEILQAATEVIKFAKVVIKKEMKAIEGSLHEQS